MSMERSKWLCKCLNLIHKGSFQSSIMIYISLSLLYKMNLVGKDKYASLVWWWCSGGLGVCLVMAVVRALIYNLIWEPFLVSCQAQSSLRMWISGTQLAGIIQMFLIQWNFFYCGNWIDFLNLDMLELSSVAAEREYHSVDLKDYCYHITALDRLTSHLNSAFPDKLEENK